MAFGFHRHYLESFSSEGLSKEQFLVIAIEAASTLQWRIKYVGENGIVAEIADVNNSVPAEAVIKTEDRTAKIGCFSVNGKFSERRNNKRTAEAFISLFNEKRNQMPSEELGAKYSYLREHNFINTGNLTDQQLSPKDQYPGVIDLFIPRKDYFITPLLIDANLLVFLIMALTGVSIMEPDSASLLKWGGNFRPATMDGEWWRLFTCIFLHIGIIHLLMNMYALFFIGLLLEPHLGRLRFLSAYLFTGVAASTASLWWHADTISAGASGAVFGMYGFFLAMLTGNLIEKKTRRALLLSILFFVGYNLANGLKGGIDNAAHIGGLVSGIIIGYASMPGLKKPGSAQFKYGTLIIITLLVLGSCLVICKNTPDDIVKYYAEMNLFDANEKRALTIYALPPDTPKEMLEAEIKNKDIDYWKKNILLLDTVAHLRLPAALLERNTRLINYCELRIKTCYILLEYLKNNDAEQKKLLDEYNFQIRRIIDTLGKKPE